MTRRKISTLSLMKLSDRNLKRNIKQLQDANDKQGSIDLDRVQLSEKLQKELARRKLNVYGL